MCIYLENGMIIRTIVLVAILVCCFVKPAHADIIATGDVDPADPTTWTSTTHSYLGKVGVGTLSVTDGDEVTTEYLFVGHKGSGTLNITDGGEVTVGMDTRVGRFPGSSGTIHLNNGTLSTGSLLYGTDDLVGTGAINAGGLVSDMDLVFDSAHGLNQTFNINENANQNITLNLNVDSYSTKGAGHSDTGTMRISDGVDIESSDGFVAFKSGSIGEVTIDGAGSAWVNSNHLVVGCAGSGTLNIINGGMATSYKGSIGDEAGSFGEFIINDADSTFTSSYFSVGRYGNGTLNVIGGGKAINNYGFIGTESGSDGEVIIDGNGSIWTNSDLLYVGYRGDGTLNITGGGLVSVSGVMTVDYIGNGNSFINMSTDGMLALFGNADDSISEFLDLIEGTDAIRFWDIFILDWSDITLATFGEDYTLEYIDDITSDLNGYTVLTVGTVPETATPTADAGMDVELSADGQCGASVVLDGSGSSDEDGDELSYYWFYNDELFAEGVEVPVDLEIGEHVFTLIVNDGVQDSLPDEVVITVVDDTLPELTVTVDKPILWPANNKMVKITPSFEVFDNCSGEVAIELVGITCNQESQNDIEITDDGISLRAKREASDKEGRIYTLTYKATDNSDNETIASVEIKVPHNLGKRR